jgi:hypothetical protein
MFDDEYLGLYEPSPLEAAAAATQLGIQLAQAELAARHEQREAARDAEAFAARQGRLNEILDSTIEEVRQRYGDKLASAAGELVQQRPELVPGDDQILADPNEFRRRVETLVQLAALEVRKER